MARTCLYEERVKSRFSEITEWLESGATEKEVYKNLRIGKDAWFRYKKDHEELRNLIKNARKTPVLKIKAALLKRALGFEYEEKKVTISAVNYPDEIEEILKENNFNLDDSKMPKQVKTEVTKKIVLPDVAACLILLQHWAKDEGWTRDPQALELKKKELELKKEKIDSESW